MGRKKGAVASEVKVVSEAKVKGGAGVVSTVKEVKGGKSVAASVKGGQVGGQGVGVADEGGQVVKRGCWRIRRGGVPMSSSWSSRQWATVGVLTNASKEKPWISMRDMRKWWKTYVPGEWRSEYGILTKELDGLSKLKFVRVSRQGSRIRATRKCLRLLYGSEKWE